ncbi:peptidoglycan D,D-transpeptidase FtsI family protein [Pseudofulvimonas gallinarii]|jgi:cell division protein FtsI (penicillin-binding protein 3)|uniref:Peptidoglycan D,D-transpeptidase FtsI n=1 Tax=Pseudofulvimonas gallinarii TaxID=634155 RepID=A0A4V3UU49_9GAMM|nr:penicillin-binding protein 2 [Pseudofulvimonas gallinarii]TCS97966.1 peptidoglycan synthetase FtsI [Pseudofulvimonas gallinarii]THD13121.1 cell division protein [Pseudofulvimonas gallinarii]
MIRRRPQTNLRLRLSVVLVLLGLGTTALVVRAVDLQLVRKDFYQRQGDARFLREIAIPTSRGQILDRNGEPLAVSTPVESLWANPTVLAEHADRIPELAQALGLNADDLQRRMQEKAAAKREFDYLRRHMNPEQVERVLALDIPGVNTQREFRRYYPAGEVMSHVLGYTNIDDQGQEGLELAFDGWLAGKPGSQRVIRDRRGRVVENVELVRAPEPGKDLVLSIDRRIQYLAYRELTATLLEHNASSGSMVILDAPTGEILAMVNQPSYNNNARGNAEPAQRRNRAVTDLFEPGSVIKAFTAAAGIESGRFRPDSVLDTNGGSLHVANHTVRDIRNFGPVDLTRMLTKSSNVAAARIAMELDNRELWSVFHRIGVGEVTGSGFPGEASGVLPDAQRWGLLHKVTMSYGYAISMTALQLAQAYGALANHGMLVPPTFVKGTRRTPREVFDPGLARTIVAMLETVTGPEGSGTRARVANYSVAGKTGTSRRATAGGYESRYVSVFAGMIPASSPRLVGIVVINDPQGGVYYGGLVAAPVFGRVMDGAMRLLDVAPDRVLAAVDRLPPPEDSAESLPDLPAELLQFAEGVQP